MLFKILTFLLSQYSFQNVAGGKHYEPSNTDNLSSHEMKSLSLLPPLYIPSALLIFLTTLFLIIFRRLMYFLLYIVDNGSCLQHHIKIWLKKVLCIY
jgi:hypothetical protein